MSVEDDEFIIIVTDGSLNRQTGTAGWGAAIKKNWQPARDSIRLSGEIQAATITRVELTAILQSLRWAVENYPDHKIVLYSDSKNNISILQRLDNFKERLIKRSIDKDLLNEIIPIKEKHCIKFRWGGRMKTAEGRIADALAKKISGVKMGAVK